MKHNLLKQIFVMLAVVFMTSVAFGQVVPIVMQPGTLPTDGTVGNGEWTDPTTGITFTYVGCQWDNATPAFLVPKGGTISFSVNGLGTIYTDNLNPLLNKLGVFVEQEDLSWFRVTASISGLDKEYSPLSFGAMNIQLGRVKDTPTFTTLYLEEWSNAATSLEVLGIDRNLLSVNRPFSFDIASVDDAGLSGTLADGSWVNVTGVVTPDGAVKADSTMDLIQAKGSMGFNFTSIGDYTLTLSSNNAAYTEVVKTFTIMKELAPVAEWEFYSMISDDVLSNYFPEVATPANETAVFSTNNGVISTINGFLRQDAVAIQDELTLDWTFNFASDLYTTVSTIGKSEVYVFTNLDANSVAGPDKMILSYSLDNVSYTEVGVVNVGQVGFSIGNLLALPVEAENQAIVYLKYMLDPTAAHLSTEGLETAGSPNVRYYEIKVVAGDVAPINVATSMTATGPVGEVVLDDVVSFTIDAVGDDTNAGYNADGTFVNVTAELSLNGDSITSWVLDLAGSSAVTGDYTIADEGDYTLTVVDNGAVLADVTNSFTVGSVEVVNVATSMYITGLDAAEITTADVLGYSVFAIGDDQAAGFNADGSNVNVSAAIAPTDNVSVSSWTLELVEGTAVSGDFDISMPGDYTLTVTDAAGVLSEVTKTFSVIFPVSAFSPKTEKFGMYPNPATDVVNITNCDIAGIEMINLLGQTILVDNSGSNSINISSLLKGQYFIKITTAENDVIFEKLMKK